MNGTYLNFDNELSAVRAVIRGVVPLSRQLTHTRQENCGGSLREKMVRPFASFPI